MSLKLAKRRSVDRLIGCGEMGSSLPEVMATVGIVAILMAVASLGLNRNFADLETAHQELANDARESRLRATLKGSHYRISALSTFYEVARLHDPDSDGLWDVDLSAPLKTVHLPPGITIAAIKISGGSAPAEYNSRGVLVDAVGGAAEVIHFTLTDAHGETRVVELWPSGQVATKSIVTAFP